MGIWIGGMVIREPLRPLRFGEAVGIQAAALMISALPLSSGWTSRPLKRRPAPD